VNGGKVSFSLLELVCADGKQIDCVKLWGDVWDEEGGECDVKWEDWFDAMSHIEGGVAS